MMRNQKGLTISGFLTWAVIFIIAALIGFKIGPAYWENVKIKKMFKALAEDPNLASGNKQALHNAFQMRNAIDDISAITSKDIEITKVGTDIVLSATYQKCVPLVSNISACMDFTATSK